MMSLSILGICGPTLVQVGHDRGFLVAQGIGDWGEVIVIAIVVAMSALNGVIQAAKKKKEARERKREIRPPKPVVEKAPPKAPAARRTTFERPTARVRRPIPLRPKPSSTRPSTVSESPPTANVPDGLEQLAEVIRESVRRKPKPVPVRSRRDAAKRQPTRVVKRTPPEKRSPQRIAQRDFIEQHERGHEQGTKKRMGHVAEGLVQPVIETKEETRPQVGALFGVDLRRAIILREILGPPLALRDTQDYFSP